MPTFFLKSFKNLQTSGIIGVDRIKHFRGALSNFSKYQLKVMADFIFENGTIFQTMACSGVHRFKKATD